MRGLSAVEQLCARMPMLAGCQVNGLGAAAAPSVDPQAETKRVIAELQKLYGEALNRVDAAIKDLEKAAGWFQSSEDKAKIALYKKQAADNRKQYNEWNALKGEEWLKTWSNTAGLKQRFQSMVYFAEQIQASAAIAKVSFWDGFWENLGKNYMDLLSKFPTPKDIFGAIPWIVGGIALVAFFPLIRGFSKAGGRALGYHQGYPHRRMRF